MRSPSPSGLGSVAARGAGLFAAATCAQSVFGHVNVLICKRDDIPTFTLMVARSLGRDVWHALCEAAAQYGYDVLPPGPF